MTTKFSKKHQANHSECNVYVKRHCSQTGLYCIPHNKWLAGLNDHEVGEILQDEMIPFEDTTPTRRIQDIPWKSL
jgi:hypothetical protein